MDKAGHGRVRNAPENPSYVESGMPAVCLFGLDWAPDFAKPGMLGQKACKCQLIVTVISCDGFLSQLVLGII